MISRHLKHILLWALLALVLYGAVPQERIAWALLLFVAARGVVLAREALTRPITEADWAGVYEKLLQHYSSATREEIEDHARTLGLPATASAADLARATLAAQRRAYIPPREPRVVACEAIGLLTFALLIPVDVLFYTRDFVSFRASLDWIGAGIVAASVALYAWPLLWSETLPGSSNRALWWTLPFVPALMLFYGGVTVRHPYLNPFRADHTELAAKRVLTLDSNVVAGSHADWVFAWAKQLEEQGDLAQAIWVYRNGLLLEPRNADAHARLSALTADKRVAWSDDPRAVRADSPDELARLPLWNEGEVAAPLRCAIDAHLGEIDRTTIVIVPIGDVPEWLADIVATVVGRELLVPTCVATESVPLPPHTRVRGLVFGPQWNRQAILKAFHEHERPLPVSPAKYVLLTNADIYTDDTNFVFSWSYSWGAVVSFARYGDPELEQRTVVRRTAKQVLGALVKSFTPMSTEPICVTSYSRSLPELDAKGNRPSVETFAIFQRALSDRDRGWTAERSRLARPPTSP